MRKWNLLLLTAVIAILTFSTAGCVERHLTINTEPSGAVVTLNDEEIGESPVTVEFQWYGDYDVRISKQGYETLKTHRDLEGSWYDMFPFDFFAQVLTSKRIVDKYEWTFELEPRKTMSRDQLITEAENLKKQME